MASSPLTQALGLGRAMVSWSAQELQETLTCLRSAQDALESGLGQALAAGCLADARACLTRLMGGDRSEDLLHEIFGRFCIGK